ncbi:MAG: crotonase/enoyl-CoA hydratase family protein [Ilumatobacteraceae bacterium]
MITSTQGRIAIITLDRPAVRNAVNSEMARIIGAAVAAAEHDPEIWVIVITGNGPAFCAGADLRMIADGGSAMTDDGGFAGITALERTKPLIAAVDGPALAGGFEIVLACDMVVAGESASFGIPEVRRALLAAAGGVIRLPHRIPRNIATELAVTGGTISADRAHQLGLVNRLVPTGAALAGALTLAAEVVANPPIAVRLALEISRLSSEHGEPAAWERNDAAMAEIQQSEDFREGPLAFLDKREPVWTGT